MVERSRLHDSMGRVRAVVAGILTSGALVTGPLAMAPPAMATCESSSDTDESSCPNPGTNQAELDAAKREARTAGDEARRINQQMVQEQLQFWTAQKAYGVGSSDPRYQEKARTYADALTAFLAAQDKANAADERVKTLEQKSAVEADRGQTDDGETAEGAGPTAADVDEAAKAREAKEDAEWREHVRWGGPTEAQLNEAKAALSVAREESERLKKVVDKAWREYATAQLTYGVDCQDPRCQERSRAFEAATDAFMPVSQKESKADAHVKALNEKATAAAARRAEEEEAERIQAKALAGPTATEIETAMKNAQAARDELARLGNIEHRIKQELTDADKTYAANKQDPRYQEKLRAYHDADDATSAARVKADSAERREQGLKRAAEEAVSRRAIRERDAKDEADRRANPTELDRLRTKAARAWTELHDATEFSGLTVDDPRYQEKLRAYEEASRTLRALTDQNHEGAQDATMGASGATG